MKPPRVGVVGTGYWGKNLLRNFAALGALEAFCDADKTTLERHAERYDQTRAYNDIGALLADDALDAVAIATPAETHGVLTRRALEAGKHVFVEKPLCLDLEEAAVLDELAHARGLVLMVGHLLLYHPAFVALREFVDTGKIGELRYVYSTRASLGKIRREENALWSFAPHDVSMILQLAGTVPERVTCAGGSWLHPGVADTSLSHLSFADGVQGHIFVSWLHPYKDHRLVVVGSDGMVVFNDVESGAQKLLHYPHEVAWSGDLPTVDKAEAVPISYAPTEPLAQECAHFLSCVANGERPVSDASEGRRVLSVLDACQRSLREGLPMVPDDIS